MNQGKKEDSKSIPKLTFHFSVRVTISCRMVFDDYPLDDHSCQFQVGSCKLMKSSSSELSINVFMSLDYDTIETVTCKSYYIYDQVRTILSVFRGNYYISISGASEKSSTLHSNRRSSATFLNCRSSLRFTVWIINNNLITSILHSINL